MPTVKKILFLAFPICLLAFSVGLYQFFDWFRDRFFFLFGRTDAAVLWGVDFKRIRYLEPLPPFIKYFLYTNEHQPDHPSTMFWDIEKFIYRCFPGNNIHNDIDFQLAGYYTYFWYFTSKGRNIPITVVSLLPKIVLGKYHVVIFWNGCVAGPLRGLGYGPFLFYESIQRYLNKDSMLTVDLNKFYFIYSVHVYENPYSLKTCSSYVSSGIFQYVFIGNMPTKSHTIGDVLKRFDVAASNTNDTNRSSSVRYHISRYTNAFKEGKLTDELLGELIIPEVTEYRELSMCGDGTIFGNQIFEEKTVARGVCKRMLEFMDYVNQREK